MHFVTGGGDIAWWYLAHFTSRCRKQRPKRRRRLFRRRKSNLETELGLSAGKFFQTAAASHACANERTTHSRRGAANWRRGLSADKPANPGDRYAFDDSNPCLKWPIRGVLLRRTRSVKNLARNLIAAIGHPLSAISPYIFRYAPRISTRDGKAFARTCKNISRSIPFHFAFSYWVNRLFLRRRSIILKRNKSMTYVLRSDINTAPAPSFPNE